MGPGWLAGSGGQVENQRTQLLFVWTRSASVTLRWHILGWSLGSFPSGGGVEDAIDVLAKWTGFFLGPWTMGNGQWAGPAMGLMGIWRNSNPPPRLARLDTTLLVARP